MVCAIAGLSIQPLVAQEQETKDKKKVAWTSSLPEFMVVAERPMKEIGMQKTKIKEPALHENIALSMADVLTQNSTLFIKQYGRATLSTASFRGTSPSHTQVTWNGLKLNSPMIGMVDFSMIPSYFIDDAALYHGTSSVNVSGGGLGGAISLGTKPAQLDGFQMKYVQGVGSFNTFDEFLHLGYGSQKWQLSTRAVLSSSDNDYKYTNYNKKKNIYNKEGDIVGQYYPKERNKSGDFRDFHLLQEAYYNTGKGDRFGLTAWYINSRRGVPMLSVDYKDDAEYVNRQREQTLRSAISWNRVREQFKLGATGGYTYTNMGYDYSRDLGNQTMINMIHSRSRVHSFTGSFDAEYYLGNKWLFTANTSLQNHWVRSEDKSVMSQEGNHVKIGYDKARLEWNTTVSAKWKPTDRLGLSATLRQEMYGSNWAPIIPAFFADYLLSKRGNIVAKASVSKNYRFPSLNDLYFQPGGNPDLKKEEGLTYDAGISFGWAKEKAYSMTGELTWFDSYINDWIVWLPTFKGFWTPQNVKKVHAYGIELKGGADVILPRGVILGLDGNFSWTPSINKGDPANWADESIGKQLVYVPKYSSAITARLTYRSWRLMYKWSYYSERFTTSSNEMSTKVGRVLPYYMSDVTLEKSFSPRWADLSLKLAINNIFNEEYESVLSRPMPRANFEVFFEIRPKFMNR